MTQFEPNRYLKSRTPSPTRIINLSNSIHISSRHKPFSSI